MAPGFRDGYRPVGTDVLDGLDDATGPTHLDLVRDRLAGKSEVQLLCVLGIGAATGEKLLHLGHTTGRNFDNGADTEVVAFRPPQPDLEPGVAKVVGQVVSEQVVPVVQAVREKVLVAIAIIVGRAQALSLAGEPEARDLGDVGKSAVSVVLIEQVYVTGLYLPSAGDPVMPVYQGEVHVAVVIRVEETHAPTHARAAAGPGCSRHLAEGAVAVIAEEEVRGKTHSDTAPRHGAPVRDVKVQVSVTIVVSRIDPHPLPNQKDSASLRDLGEGPVTVVLVEVVAAAVHREEQVQGVVVVIIEPEGLERRA